MIREMSLIDLQGSFLSVKICVQYVLNSSMKLYCVHAKAVFEMIPKPLDQITKADIDALIEDRVAESKTLEFKRDLPDKKDKDKREYLADVSAFANVSGGDILYGVDEDDEGIASEACGLRDFNEDVDKSRLENTLNTGIDPKLRGVEFRVIKGFPSGPVLILRIHKSWNAPHRVIFDKSSRFYLRRNTGKEPMDMSEIRDSFLRSGELADRIRQWSDARIQQIIQDQIPMLLSSACRMVVHFVPYMSMNPQTNFTAEAIERSGVSFSPIDSGGRNSTYNIDGKLTYATDGSTTSPAYSYTQVFRSGKVESVVSDFLEITGDHRCFPMNWFEKQLYGTCHTYMRDLKTLGVQPPIAIMVSILNAEKTPMCGNLASARGIMPTIDRQWLRLQDVLFDDFNCDVLRALRPVFDSIWNAFGHVRSKNFDQNGKWHA